MRFEHGIPQIVVGRRVRAREGMSWVLPKGTPAEGETREATALREVEEETGLQVRIVASLGEIHYTFQRRGTRVDKTVHHYLMRPVAGSFERHDREFEEVRWAPLVEALRLLTFATERSVVERAQAAIANLGDAAAIATFGDAAASADREDRAATAHRADTGAVAAPEDEGGT